MPVAIRDLKGYTCIVAGIPLNLMGGFGEGDGTFKIEWDSEEFTDTIGATGAVCRSKTYDNRAKVTVSLLQSALGNAVLSALNNLDVNVDNGAGIGPFYFRDQNGTTELTSDACWVMRPKTITISAKPGNNEWVIRCSELIGVIGGN